MRQYKIIEIGLSPYQYNPITLKLRTIAGGKLVLSFKRTCEAAVWNRDPTSESFLKDTVVNFEVVAQYEPQNGDTLCAL